MGRPLPLFNFFRSIHSDLDRVQGFEQMPQAKPLGWFILNLCPSSPLWVVYKHFPRAAGMGGKRTRAIGSNTQPARPVCTRLQLPQAALQRELRETKSANPP